MTILRGFAVWLAHSPITAAVTARFWFVPEIQIIHIAAIAAVVIAVALINLRAVGLIETDRPLRAVLDTWLRVILIAVAVLAVTGFLLIASEPGRALFRTVFWVKLGLIAVALAVTAAHGLIAQGEGDAEHRPTLARRALAIVSVLAWTGVIFAGRWIAYAEGWPGAFS
jgi:hypothetical protein